MRAAIVLVLVAAAAATAAAETKVMVLQSEGRADAKTRQKIDAAVVKLAKTTPDTISPGEITYTDAAALVGCKPDDASCKDEVLGTLAVDEIIITTVTPRPGGLEVNVKRVRKGGAAREATTTVTADQPDKLDAIAPLFGGKAPATPTGPTGPTPIGPTGPTGPAVVIGPQRPPETPEVKPTELKPAEVKPADTKVDLSPIGETTKPPTPVDTDDRWTTRHRRQLYIGGWAGGGGMVLLSFIFWGAAASTQGDIDNLQVRNGADLAKLRELEDKGDSRAGWGNFFFVGGLVAAGVGTYFYVKERRAKHSTSSARLVPTLLDHGAGVALTFGGSP